MEYMELKLLKQSEKSTVRLVREKAGERVFIQKRLAGRRDIYEVLQNCPHAYLPKIYEVTVSDADTTVLEEYVEGQSLGSVELSEKQFLCAVKELCDVLGFLHGKGIIHRDLKPSNIILADDGHIRLLDFDAARMPKDEMEYDTRLLGTRGYAPPEQYGFAQTDVRTDIYALGVTLKQLLGDKAGKLRYRRILRKCTRLDPDKRYQSVSQVKRAFCYRKRGVLYGSAGLILAVFLWCLIPRQPIMDESGRPESAALTVLPAPENPHWDGDTGIAVWGNVPESGTEDEVQYYWRLYRSDAAVPPGFDDICNKEGSMRGNMSVVENAPAYRLNLANELGENGFYYFEVSAQGDGDRYADSPFVMSDAFEYTGESAPPLPAPEGLAWNVFENDHGLQCYATWSNLDDYEDADSFNVRVYDESGGQVRNNIWTKGQILSMGPGGVWFDAALFGTGNAYRFTVQAYTSRPNEFRSSLMPDPVPEEYFSPWYELGQQ